jgi:hypothetical protein
LTRWRLLKRLEIEEHLKPSPHRRVGVPPSTKAAMSTLVRTARDQATLHPREWDRRAAASAVGGDSTD